MPSQLTVTGKIGPGLTETAQVYSDITEFGILTDSQTLFLRQRTTNVPQYVDITGKTTITVTVSSGTYTVSIS